MNMTKNTYIPPRISNLRSALLHAAVACATLVAFSASAATVEFKLSPDVKGREYRATMNHLQAMGVMSASTTNLGALTLTTINDAAASNALQALREKSSVLWAAIPSNEVSAKEATSSLPTFHGRQLVLELRDQFSATGVVSRLAASTGQAVQLKRISQGYRAIVVLPESTTPATMAAVMVAAEAEASVSKVERVRLATHQWVPNDALSAQQWSLGAGVGGIRAFEAWDITPSGSVQIAVIDTGIRSHPDLDSKRVAGYDMISFEFISADGDGRDSDPSDPGDTDAALECRRPRIASSWHGTHVAGIAAASSNNQEGISGVAPNARIQSVRALGHCGGTEEDIADSIRWAAGVAVAGAPLNPVPSKVINMSLGSVVSGACSSNMQAAVDSAIAKGAVIVAAAGNSADIADYWPANCKGVIAVAASNILGDISNYSNYGRVVAITAPGGENRAPGSPSILSTLNGGVTQAAAASYATYAGTSMAAPHVAGVVALMLARDPSLTSGQLLNRLQSGARSFPAGSDCATVVGACGSGLLDAANAVAGVTLNRALNEVASSRDRVHAVELLNVSNGRYMLSADPTEVFRLVINGTWVRTGQVISTFSFTAPYGNGASVSQPVCRAVVGAGTAFVYSANTAECNTYDQSGLGYTSHGMSFSAALPNSGTCPTGSTPVWELLKTDVLGYNTRNVADTNEISRMLSQGWAYSRIAFCAPN